MSEEELQALIKLGAGEKRDYDTSKTLIDLFKEQTKRTPDSVAVIDNESQYTYGEVDLYSDVLAHILVEEGVNPGDHVCVSLPRRKEFILAVFGTMKAGAVYVPIDMEYPEERKRFIVEDTEAKAVINIEWLKSHASQLSRGMTNLQPSPLIVEPSSPAYIIYTSGSTGKPKGVVIPHRALSHLVQFVTDEWKMNEGSRIVCQASFSFDSTVENLFAVLTVGGATCIVPEGARKDLRQLHQFIVDKEVTGGSYTPQLGQLLLQEYPDLPVDYLVAGGDKMTMNPPCKGRLINVYGPTEFTVDATYYELEPGRQYENIPIGRPLPDQTAYIIDENKRLLPRGMAGELCLAGIHMAIGYWKRDELTEQRFTDILVDGKAVKVYRTGDLCRWNEEGLLEHLGRIDQQVKLRGFRIELGEIESLAMKYKGIRQAAASVYDNRLLCLYYVQNEESIINHEELRAFLAKNLPDYMVPAFYIPLDDLPLTPNCKIDRKRLPAPELTSEMQYVEPSDELEAELCRAFATVLGHDRVGAQSGFFEMGGDSISVMRLITECPSLGLSFRLIFDGSTPAGIASLIRERDTAARDMECKEGDGGLKGHFFGPLQRQHYEWGNEIFEGYGVHCDATIHMGKETDPVRLAQVVACVIKAHPALDARLIETEDGTFRWFCVEDALKDYTITPEYVTRSVYSELQGKLRKSMNRPGERMFNIRIFIITEEDGTESCDFYFDFLHPITDGVSIDIFLDDVNAAYEGRKVEKETFSVLDYYDQIEKEVSTGRYRSEVEWNRRFAASFTDRAGELEGDLSCGDENETLAIFEKLDIEPEIVENYAAACKVTVGSLLSAAYGLIQASCNGEYSAVTLTIYNGRDDARYQRTMGAIYRHLPLCVRFDDDMTARDYVRATEKNILSCRAHFLYEPDPVPMITSFSYQGEDLPEPFPFCSGLASYEETEDYEEEIFNFFVHRRQDGFYVNLTYNALSYSKTFIDRLLKDYAMVLRSLSTGVRPADIHISCCSLIKSHNRKDDENEQQA